MKKANPTTTEPQRKSSRIRAMKHKPDREGDEGGEKKRKKSPPKPVGGGEVKETNEEVRNFLYRC